MVGDAVLGLAVLADQSLIAGAYYHALARPWGPSLRTDQVIGGGALWVLGDIVGLPFLAAQFIQMIREDETEAASVDAELDAVEAAEAAAAAGAPDEAGHVPDEPAGQQPWWQSDPRFADRFRSGGRSRAIPSPRTAGDGRSVGPLDQERPATWQGRLHHELLRLHHAPGRDVGLGRGIVSQHGDGRPDRDLRIRSASMMIGIGHLRPSASIVSIGAGRVGGHPHASFSRSPGRAGAAAGLLPGMRHTAGHHLPLER